MISALLWRSQSYVLQQPLVLLRYIQLGDTFVLKFQNVTTLSFTLTILLVKKLSLIHPLHLCLSSEQAQIQKHIGGSCKFRDLSVKVFADSDCCSDKGLSSLL